MPVEDFVTWSNVVWSEGTATRKNVRECLAKLAVKVQELFVGCDCGTVATRTAGGSNPSAGSLQQLINDIIKSIEAEDAKSGRQPWHGVPACNSEMVIPCKDGMVRQECSISMDKEYQTKYQLMQTKFWGRRIWRPTTKERGSATSVKIYAVCDFYWYISPWDFSNPPVLCYEPPCGPATPVACLCGADDRCACGTGQADWGLLVAEASIAGSPAFTAGMHQEFWFSALARHAAERAEDKETGAAPRWDGNDL